MAKRNYIFDSEDFGFKKERSPWVNALISAVWMLLGSVVMAVIYYAIYALLFYTDTERRLAQENRTYEKQYSELRHRERLLRDVVKELEIRDDEIYYAVFNTSAPSMSDLSTGNLLSDNEDELQDQDIFKYSASKADKALASVAVVESNFRKVFETCEKPWCSLPPMVLPVAGFNVARTGAGVGTKISPFYKVNTVHDGIDLIAPAGTSVLAGGAGVVISVNRSAQADGNTIVIDHGNGYTSKYAHLSDIKVASGSKVKAGQIIGTVGTSGKSFAPHLHYCVFRGGEPCDPVNYFFSSVTPQDYASMLVLSSSVAQSMD